MSDRSNVSWEKLAWYEAEAEAQGHIAAALQTYAAEHARQARDARLRALQIREQLDSEEVR